MSVPPVATPYRPLRRRGNARFRKTHLFANRLPRQCRSRLAAKPRVVLLGPFGEPLTNPTGLAAEMPFRFSTHYTDEETGLVYAKRRYYSPTTGRWMSRDPIGEQGGLNLYSYVRNQPTITIDPFGLQTWQIWPFGGPAKPCPCKCKSVTWTFNPGGEQFQFGILGGNRIGNDIKIVWSVDGDESKCKLEHNEDGTLVFNRMSPTEKDEALAQGLRI